MNRFPASKSILRPALRWKRTSFWILLFIGFAAAPTLQAQPVLPGNPPFFQNPNSEKLIVFVHGLTGDPVKTWSSDDDSPFFWPQQLVRDADFKNADVLSFGYKTDCGVTFNIRQIAQKLETTLTQLDWLNRYQSVSFVAHSMGGLVTRQFILDHYEKTRIDSVVLLSAPNFGNHLAKLPGLFCDSAHLKELNPGGYIDILNDNWRKVFRENREREPFHFSAGYELAPTYKLIKVGIIVDKNAAVNFASHTRGFLKDHSHIAKPNGLDDLLYVWTKQRLLKKVPDLGNQYTEAEEKRFEAIIDSLQKELAGTDLEKALKLIAKGNLDEALALLSAHENKEDEQILKIAKTNFAKAQVYILQLKYKNALKYYEKSVQLAPKNLKYQNQAGLMANTLGQYGTAIVYFEKALANGLRTFGPNHPSVAILWNNLGEAWRAKGQYDKAIGYHEKAVENFRKNLGDSHPNVARCWNNLGAAWKDKGQYDKAIEYYEKALTSNLKTFGPDHPKVAIRWNNLGSAWTSKGEYDKAIGYHEKALASDLKTFGPEHPKVAMSWNNLGSAWDSKGKTDKAIEYYEKARDIFKKFSLDHRVAMVKQNIEVARRKKDGR